MKTDVILWNKVCVTVFFFLYYPYPYIALTLPASGGNWWKPAQER